jgi:LAGLIDADG DNA endonuclease family
MQEELLIALALGDGHLAYNKSKIKAYLHIRHSNHQKDYIEWKYNLCKELWQHSPKGYKNTLNGKQYYGYYLQSHLDMKLADIKKELYPNHHKEYTREILNKLTPLGLAIWYMDDGCVDRPVGKNSMGLLNTYGKSSEAKEELIIQKYFKEKWDIDCAINKGHGRYRIRFNHPNFCKLVEIIKPYVIDSLKYKINTSMRTSKRDFPSLELRSKSNRYNAPTKLVYN